MDIPRGTPDPRRSDPLVAARQLRRKLEAGYLWTAAQLYEGYVDWSRRRKLEPVHINQWGKALREVGFEPVTIHNVRMWRVAWDEIFDGTYNIF